MAAKAAVNVDFERGNVDSRYHQIYIKVRKDFAFCEGDDRRVHWPSDSPAPSILPLRLRLLAAMYIPRRVLPTMLRRGAVNTKERTLSRL